MKDNNIQNIADLIGALAEDIEEVKKKLDATDNPDKDEAVKRLAVKLELVIRFFGGSTPKNISEIFGSRESVENYKKSLCDGVIVSMEEYTDATNKDMCKRGIPTIKDLLYKILEMQTELVDNHKPSTEAAQQRQGSWLAIRTDNVVKSIKRQWAKVPDGWHKNPYAWAGIGCTLVFFTLFTVSWVQWHEYREENRRLRTVADKHHVTTSMLNELHPELAVTVGAYEKLVDVVGADSTLAIFNRQVKIAREEEKQSKQQK